MFITKFLKPHEVTEINTLGNCIKVMNCEGKFRIKATLQGQPVLETDARAGFDVQTGKPFDLLVITSETNQKLELWASQHKLSYDALSTKASRATSFLAEHYGHGQQIIGYDTAQSRVTVVCDKPWWLGGEGVSKKNGIPMAANGKYIHDSAAPLSAYIDEAPAKTLNTNDMNIIEQPVHYDQHTIRKINEHLVYFGGNTGTRIYDAKTNKHTTVSLTQGENIVGRMFEIDDVIYSVMHEGITEHETRLCKIDNGEVFYMPMQTPNTFIALGCDEYKGKVYIVGADRAEGTKRGKIYTADAGFPYENFTEVDTNIKTGEPLKLDKIFIDQNTGAVWVIEDNNVYKGSIALTDFVLMGEVEGIVNTDPSFMGDWAVFTAKPTAAPICSSHMVHTEYGVLSAAEFFNDGSQYDITYFKDRLAVAYNVNGVYWALGETDPTKFTSFNNDVDISELATILELNNKLYVFSVNDRGVRNALVVGLEIDRDVPRAIFRAYKESY